MSDYLKELPHESDCELVTVREAEIAAGWAPDHITPCTCRRAEALAYVEGLKAENSLIDAAENAQQTLQKHIAELEAEKRELRAVVLAKDGQIERLRAYVSVMASQYTAEEREEADFCCGDVSDGFDIAILDARKALEPSK